MSESKTNIICLVIIMALLVFIFGCGPRQDFLSEDDLAKEARLLKMADTAIEANNIEHAWSYIEEAREINNRSAYSYYLSATIFREEGNIEKTIENYETYLELNPNDELDVKDEINEVLSKAGYVEQMNEYLNLNEEYGKFIELYERFENYLDETFYDKAGWSYYKLGEFQKSIEYFEKAIELNSNDDQSYKGVGWSCLELEKYEKARENFEKAIEIYPEKDSRYEGVGWSYYKLQNYEDARENFEKAIEIDKDCYSYNGLGRTEFKMGNVETAKGHLKKSLEIDPECKIPEEMQYLVS